MAVQYWLRAWKNGGDLYTEEHYSLEKAHNRQLELQRQGYFSWVLDIETDNNVSVFLNKA